MRKHKICCNLVSVRGQVLHLLRLHPPMLTTATPGRTPPRHGYLQQAMTTLTDPGPSTATMSEEMNNIQEDEGSSEQPCYLSDAQTVQLWDQIQQVAAPTVANGSECFVSVALSDAHANFYTDQIRTITCVPVSDSITSNRKHNYSNILHCACIVGRDLEMVQ